MRTAIYFFNSFTGLKNDTVPETFRLKHVVHDHYLPVNYVKITPLECWKPSFNFSIWYVSLEGDDTSEMVQNSLAWHDQVSIFGKFYQNLRFFAGFVLFWLYLGTLVRFSRRR